jgi:hypothetical protein
MRLINARSARTPAIGCSSGGDSRFLAALGLSLCLALPASAQRGAPPGRGGGTGSGRPTGTSQAQTRDTTRKTTQQQQQPFAVALDFQSQDLSVVLDAIAAAGQLNVSLSNIPQQRVTMHMAKPVPRDSMASVLKSIAEQYGLRVTMTPSLIQIAGTPVDNTRATQQTQQSLAQQLLQQNQQQQVRIFPLRLRHTSAVQLAPVLSSLFSGFSGNQTFGGRGTTTIVPNAQGGFNVIGGQVNTPAVRLGTFKRFSRRSRTTTRVVAGAVAARRSNNRSPINWRSGSGRSPARSPVRRRRFASSPKRRATRCSCARRNRTSS